MKHALLFKVAFLLELCKSTPFCCKLPQNVEIRHFLLQKDGFRAVSQKIACIATTITTTSSTTTSTTTTTTITTTSTTTTGLFAADSPSSPTVPWRTAAAWGSYVKLDQIHWRWQHWWQSDHIYWHLDSFLVYLFKHPPNDKSYKKPTIRIGKCNSYRSSNQKKPHGNRCNLKKMPERTKEKPKDTDKRDRSTKQ